MSAHTRATILLSLLALTPLAVRPDVAYTISLQPDAEKIPVSITLPVKSKVTQFQIPNWEPGNYTKSNYAGRIDNVIASAAGGPVVTEHPDKNTWSVNTAGLKTITLTYDLKQRVGKTGHQVVGPGTYMYVVGRKTEKSYISFAVPPAWKVACPLDPAGDGRWSAPNYDVLADAPTQVGEFTDEIVSVRGIPIHIITYGAGAASLDRKRLNEMCGKIVESQAAFFGGLPYKRYYFFFNTFRGTDGGGGLEHLNSTQIFLASGVGNRALWVIAHEHFHAWNVKRIRPLVLGPFDYVGYPQTHNLWWSEGVTDYYSRLLSLRGGVFDQAEFIRTLQEVMEDVQNNPARLKVSADEASWRVFEANNSSGYGGLSYYDKGDMVGLCLDLKLRDLTNGKRSLDDVMKALWTMGDKGKGPGFGEDTIRDLCIKFGGVEMGPFYDKVARSPGELPYEELLSNVGINVKVDTTTSPDYGARFVADSENSGVRVRGIRGSGPMESAGVESGDVIVEIEGSPIAIAGTDMTTAANGAIRRMNEMPPGKPIKIVVMRDDKRVEATVTPSTRTASKVNLTMSPNPTERESKLRTGWLTGK